MLRIASCWEQERTSLVAQWLRIHLPTWAVQVRPPWSRIPHAVWQDQKCKIEINKTWWEQEKEVQLERYKGTRRLALISVTRQPWLSWTHLHLVPWPGIRCRVYSLGQTWDGTAVATRCGCHACGPQLCFQSRKSLTQPPAPLEAVLALESSSD